MLPDPLTRHRNLFGEVGSHDSRELAEQDHQGISSERIHRSTAAVAVSYHSALINSLNGRAEELLDQFDLHVESC